MMSDHLGVWDRIKAGARLMMDGDLSPYRGASYTRAQTRDWIAHYGSGDKHVAYHLDTLRNRSRDLYRNAPLARGAINSYVENVVGRGLRPMPTANPGVLGMSMGEYSDWSAGVRREFELYASDMDVDAYGESTLYALQEQVTRSMLVDGDCFVLLPYRRRPGNEYQTAIQLVSADRVKNPGGVITNRIDGGSYTVNGVKKDSQGRATHIYVAQHDPNSLYFTSPQGYTEVLIRDAQTGRRNVLHMKPVEDIGQTRGLPFLTPVLEALYTHDKFLSAELLATAISAMYTVYLKGFNEDARADGGFPTPVLKAGQTNVLADGEDVVFAKPERPNSIFQPFVDELTMEIGAALGIPSEVLRKRFLASYSAARAVMLSAQKYFDMRRQTLIQKFCVPIYREWFADAVIAGRITAPGFFSDAALRSEYMRCNWIGAPAGAIDPLKEVQALQLQIQSGLITLDEACILHTGVSFYEKVPQFEREMELRRRFGFVTVTTKPANEPTEAANRPEDAESDRPVGRPSEDGEEEDANDERAESRV